MTYPLPDHPQDRLVEAVGIGRQAVEAEAAAVAALAGRIDDQFREAVRLILDHAGRVVLTGMGKSGFIARKLAATFSSTGTPSFFLHPAEGAHGDLGAVTEEDLVIALSYSGESDEITALLPGLKRLGAPIIALVSQPQSTLGRAANIVLDVTVDREACPLNLAPTASTAALLAMGDALAMAVMHVRNFTPEQFARYHPAGSLGRRLLLVDEVMRPAEESALVGPEVPVEEVMFSIMRTRLGAAIVVDRAGCLLGIITDGDIRSRSYERGDLRQLRAREIMTTNPRVTQSGRLAVEALATMQAPPRPLNVLPVVDAEGRVIGATHIQDLVRIGIG